ncbi:MAG: hypothetical protein IKT92_04230 [Bacteroidaceae bacterium]|nr:hypothetical protein [Bacteroidaceae bacterium]
MKNVFRRSFAAMALLACVLPGSAQEFRSSYFSKMSKFNHQMNPALIDENYGAFLLGQVSATATGNVGLGNFVYEVNDVEGEDYVSFMSDRVDTNAFLSDLEAENKFNFYLNYNLFSFGFKGWGGSNLLELNLRSSMNAIVPYEFFKFAKEEGVGSEYHVNDMTFNTQNYLELALGHARDITDKLRVGAKVKVLVGAAYADFDVNNLDIVKESNLKWKVQGDMHLEAALMDSEVKYSQQMSQDGRRRIKGFDDFTFGLSGLGIAADLGATYKLTDDLTLSAAVTDLGFIKWKDVHAATSAGEYEFDGFQYSKEATAAGKTKDAALDDLQKDLEQLFALYEDADRDVNQTLAATVNAGAEYTMPFYRKMSVGVLYTGRFHGDYSWHQGMVSANVRPLNWLEVNANASMTSTGFAMGGLVNFKLGGVGLYVGSDQLIGSLPSEILTAKDANSQLTFGMTISL